MMRTLRGLALLALTAVLQTAILRPGSNMDLFLILAALNAMRLPPPRAALEGALIGLAQDLAGGGWLGLNGLGKAVAAMAVARLHLLLTGHAVLVGTLLTFAGGVLDHGLRLGLLAATGQGDLPPLIRQLVWMPAVQAGLAAVALALTAWLRARRRRGLLLERSGP